MNSQFDVKIKKIRSKEDILEFHNDVNKTIEDLETKLSDFNKKIYQIDKRIDSFYSRIIEMMGIFVAIFSLIAITGYNLINIKGVNFIDTFLNSLACLSPLTIVLVIFVLILNWLRKK